MSQAADSGYAIATRKGNATDSDSDSDLSLGIVDFVMISIPSGSGKEKEFRCIDFDHVILALISRQFCTNAHFLSPYTHLKLVSKTNKIFSRLST